MRTLLIPALAAGLFLTSGTTRANDDVKAILEKALKAHGGKDKLAKEYAVRTKSKGTLELMGGIAFTSESAVQPPDKFKEVAQLEVMGQKVDVTVVFDGKKAWVSAAGMTMELDDKYVEEMKQGLHVMRLMRLVFINDKSIEVAGLGEGKVEGRAAVGVKVSAKGYRDVNLYFDKETGLLTKIEGRGLDETSGQEVAEERIIQEYQEIDGLKVAKKVLINRDGKKYLEAEVLEVKATDKIDDNEFAKP